MSLGTLEFAGGYDQLHVYVKLDSISGLSPEFYLMRSLFLVTRNKKPVELSPEAIFRSV